MRYFHLQQSDGKWCLVSPEGRPFFMRGANHFGDGSHMPHQLEQRYGDRAAWRRSVRDRHLEWGFNYLPPSIGPSELESEPVPPTRRGDGQPQNRARCCRTPEWPAEHFVESGMPFTVFIGYPKQFMGNNANYPDVFSKEFREGVDRRCREICAPLADEPNLIGYHFCQNPPWHPHAPGFFQWVHHIVDDGRPAKREWVRLMQRIYGDIARWRGTYSVPLASFDELLDHPFPLDGKISATKLRRDKIAFMRRVCEEWYKVMVGTIREYDPNHLILGDRNSVHLQPLAEGAVEIMKRYIDVLSINVMGPMHVALEEMEQATEYWDGPIHLADTGAGIYNGEWPKSGYMCAGVDEFAEVYGGYCRLGVEHPQVIGLGWCGYYETCSARSGLVDSVTDEPDADKVAAITRWNTWLEREYGKCFPRLSETAAVG